MKRRNLKKLQTLVLMILQGGLLVALLWFGIFYHNEFEENLTDKYRQQLSNTSATAKQSVISYFEKFSQNLIHLSHNPDIIQMANGRCNSDRNDDYCVMEGLFDIHAGEIDALILMDTSALVLKRIASDTLNFHYMMCIGNTRANPKVPPDSVYYSDIFVNHKNQKAITLSCPVYDGDKRVGVLRWMITIESITSHYLHHFCDNKELQFILTDQDGRLLSNEASYREWLCENLCKCGDRRIQGPVIGHYTELPDDGSGKLHLMPLDCEVYAGWNSFGVGARNWKLMVLMPARILDHAMWKHGVITYGMTALALLIIVSMTLLFISTRIRKSRLETASKFLEQLAESERQLKEEREMRLSAQIRGQELERQRISRELHDGLGQLLLTMRLSLRSSVQGKTGPDEETIDSIKGLLDETIDEVKRISEDLAPVLLMELGIDKALGRYCREMAALSGIKIDYVCYGIAGHPDPDRDTHLYRIAQEALTNAAKHANPGEINLQLLGGKDKITLIIQDDGSGFDYNPDQQAEGNGLANIRDRVTILNGMFNLHSKQGEGTIITVKIPLEYA